MIDGFTTYIQFGIGQLERLRMIVTMGFSIQKNHFKNILAKHSEKLEIPSHTIQGILEMAWTSWKRCYKKLAKKPRLKEKRNTLNSIPFPDPIKYHKQYIPD